MRKLIAVAIIIAIIATQMIAGVTFATNTDAKTALEQLNSLSSANKGALLGKVWDYAVAEIGNGNAVTVDGIYAEIETELTTLGIWTNVVAETSGVDGRISSANLKIIIQKLINNKQVIVDYYNVYKDTVTKSLVKELLGLPSTASEGEVFAALIPYSEPVLTLDSNNKFVRYGNISQVLADKLGVREDMFTLLIGDINAKVDSFATKLNNNITQYSINTEDVIYALEIYSLYAAPSTGDTGGGGGGGGGGAPAGNVDEIDNQLGDLVNNGGDTASKVDQAIVLIGSAAEVIDGITDPGAALDQATKIIETAGAIIDSVGNEEEYNEELSNALVDLANTVMEKVNTNTFVPAGAAGDAISTVIPESSVNSIVETFDAIVATAKTLNDTLEQSGVDGSVKAVLNIVVNSEYTDAAKESTVNLPGDLFAKASEAKIDKVAVNTGVATVALAPESYLNDGPVKLETKKLDSAALAPEVKAAVGNSVVYDFNLTVGETKISKFKKPVEITVPYTLSAGENPEKITVFYINDNGGLENEVGFYDAATQTVTFKVKHFSKYAVTENDVTFGDIASVGWAKQGIEAMAAKGVIKGVGNDKFNPSAKVTRGQFIAMIVRAMKLNDETAASSFTDVKKDSMFYNEISSAYSLGIINGVGNNKFAPEANITRQDAAVIIANTLAMVKEKKMPEASNSYINRYADNTRISGYAKPAAGLAAKYSIILGDAKGNYNPTGLATRAEAALIIYRLFNVK